MTTTPAGVPTEADAAQLVRQLLHEEPHSVTRFRTGLAHYVFEVALPKQRSVVVRMVAEDRATLDGTVYWWRRLRPLDVRLPAILADDRAARVTPFGALILERLPGTDLGHAYAALSAQERAALAGEIVQLQRRVATLPPARGYGYATAYEAAGLQPTWSNVVAQSLARSHTRIAANGRFPVRYVEQVAARAPAFERYFRSVPPRAFLDDVTTKNVLVERGRLSGIVDVDYVCFGDPLYTLALTQMALRSQEAALDYTDAWRDLLRLSPTQRAALSFYTCLFCVDFMSELGQRANGNNIAPDEAARIRQLEAIFETLMSALEMRTH